MSTISINKNKKRFKPQQTGTKRKLIQPESEQPSIKRACHESTPLVSPNKRTPLVIPQLDEETLALDVTATSPPTSPAGPTGPTISSSPSLLPCNTPPSLDLIRLTMLQYVSKDIKRVTPPQGLSKKELIETAKEEAEQAEQKEQEEKRQEEIRAATNPTRIPQVKIVNGEIVLDEISLPTDNQEEMVNHEEMDNHEKTDAYEIVDDGPFVRMQRGPKTVPQRWTVQETNLFFELLKEHGKDFTSICKGIPGKTIDQVKRKYRAEHKRYPFL